MLSTLTENVNKLTQAADTEKEPDVKLEAIADEKIVFSTTSSTSDENQVLLDGVNLHQVCHVPVVIFSLYLPCSVPLFATFILQVNRFVLCIQSDLHTPSCSSL